MQCLKHFAFSSFLLLRSLAFLYFDRLNPLALLGRYSRNSTLPQECVGIAAPARTASARARPKSLHWATRSSNGFREIAHQCSAFTTEASRILRGARKLLLTCGVLRFVRIVNSARNLERRGDGPSRARRAARHNNGLGAAVCAHRSRPAVTIRPQRASTSALGPSDA